MKRRFYLLLFSFFIMSTLNLQAFDWECGWELEFRTAAMYSSSSTFRKIYSDWEPEYQFELAKSITEHYYGWVNVAWLSDTGASLGLRNETHVRLVPITFGLKYVCPLVCNWSAYVGLGAAYTLLRLKDDSSYVKKHTSKESWGGIVKLGLHYDLAYNTFLDLFVDYLYQPFSGTKGDAIEPHSENLGGVRLGAGVGVKF